MVSKIDVLGVDFNVITMTEAVKASVDFLVAKDKKCIFTANPEIVLLAQNDVEFHKIIQKGDLVVADGIGIVIGAKWLKRPLPERVAGYDLVQNIFEQIKGTAHTVYFFGAAKGVAELAAEKMREKHPGLQIVGVHDGYYDPEEEVRIIEEINSLSPDLLLIGTGAPRQEKWIHNHLQELNIHLCIGVGGSFDVMSGNLKRAPKIFIRLGLEWFHRLLLQPTRIGRMMKLPYFLWKVLLYKFGIKRGK